LVCCLRQHLDDSLPGCSATTTCTGWEGRFNGAAMRHSAAPGTHCSSCTFSANRRKSAR
jgi:hypothetical protein